VIASRVIALRTIALRSNERTRDRLKRRLTMRFARNYHPPPHVGIRRFSLKFSVKGLSSRRGTLGGSPKLPRVPWVLTHDGRREIWAQ
jgi:hypothetical protein